jgi:hypothetical protein
MKFILIFFAFLCDLSRDNLFGALASFANVQFITAHQVQEMHRQRLAAQKGVMPMTQKRAILQYLESVYDKGVIITDSWLSNAVQLSNTGGVQNLSFNFQQTNQKAGNLSNSPIDNLLNMVDTFEVTGFRLALFKLPSTAAGSNIVSGNYGVANKQYYPNPYVFYGITGSVEWKNLMNIYNGALYVKIDSTVFFQSMQVANLLKVGNWQQGTAVSTVAYAPGDQVGGEVLFTSGDTERIEMLCAPMFMLNGSGKNDIEIQMFESSFLGSCDAAQGSQNFINFIELQLLGFLCQGGAKQGIRKV